MASAATSIIRAAELLRVGRAGDDGRGDGSVHHAAQRVAATRHRDVDFRLRVGFILRQQVQQIARDFVRRCNARDVGDAEPVQGGNNFGREIAVGGGT
jgi:hypothetical protein